MNRIPRIGLGTFRLQGQQAYDSVGNGLAAGYRHVDTAQIYGNEEEVGRALADSGVNRGEVFVRAGTSLRRAPDSAGRYPPR
jgi:2,5-diketo-D-gluconate reductase B